VRRDSVGLNACVNAQKTRLNVTKRALDDKIIRRRLFKLVAASNETILMLTAYSLRDNRKRILVQLATSSE